MKINRQSKTIYLKNRRSKGQKKARNTLLGILGAGLAIGVGISLLPNAYEIIINDQVIAVVDEKAYIDEALEMVEAQLKTAYQTDIKIAEIDKIKRVYAGKKDLTEPNNLAMYLREELPIQLEFQKLIVDNNEMGIIYSEEALDEVMNGLKRKYYRDETVEAEFANKVELEPIYTTEDQLTPMDELLDLCTKRNKEVIEYTVASGDTLWGIATKLDVTLLDILSENEGMTEQTPLRIGETINVEISVPVLGLNRIEVEPAIEEVVEEVVELATE